MSAPRPIPSELAAPDDTAWLDRLAEEAAASPEPYEYGERVASGVAPLEVAEAGSWKISDDASAEWAMRKVAEADERLAEIAAQATEWRAPIDAWAEAESARPLATRGFFGAHLTRYALERRDRTGDKSLRLPSGRVTTRSNPPKAVIVDADEVVGWAMDHAAELVEVTSSVPVSKLRSATRIDEWPTAVDVSLTCGCVVTLADDVMVLVPDDDHMDCPNCDGASGIIEATTIETRPVVVDAEGNAVPGVTVDEGRTTATVVAS